MGSIKEEDWSELKSLPDYSLFLTFPHFPKPSDFSFFFNSPNSLVDPLPLDLLLVKKQPFTFLLKATFNFTKKKKRNFSGTIQTKE